MPNWSLWEEFQTLCKTRNLDPQIITCPEKFQDHISCAKRASALRELKAKGANPSQLSTICGLAERRIQEIVKPIGRNIHQ